MPSCNGSMRCWTGMIFTSLLWHKFFNGCKILLSFLPSETLPHGRRSVMSRVNPTVPYHQPAPWRLENFPERQFDCIHVWSARKTIHGWRIRQEITLHSGNKCVTPWETDKWEERKEHIKQNEEDVSDKKRNIWHETTTKDRFVLKLFYFSLKNIRLNLQTGGIWSNFLNVIFSSLHKNHHRHDLPSEFHSKRKREKIYIIHSIQQQKWMEKNDKQLK